MNANLRLLALPLLWGTAVGAVSAAELNTIRDISVQERDGALELAVQGTRPPSYSVFKLQDPQRLVLDMAGADVSAVNAPGNVGKAGVVSVTTAQYRDQRSVVGRVVIALDGQRKYEIVPRGDAVVVRVLAAEAGTESKAAPVSESKAAVREEPKAAAHEESKAPAPVAAVEEKAPAVTAAAPLAEPAAAGDHVVARRVDEAAPAGRAARTVTAVRERADRLFVATDGQVSRIEILELRDPARLVLDLQGVSKAPRGAIPLTGTFAQVRFGQSAGKVRVVLDARQGLPACQVRRVKGGVEIAPATQAAAAPAVPATAVATTVATPEPAAAVQSPPGAEGGEKPAVAQARARIASVRFSGDAAQSRIELKGKAPFIITRPDAHTAVLTLEGAELPRSLERTLDTAAFRGPVQMVSSFNQARTGQVRIVASFRGAAADRIIESAHGLVWTFSGTPGAADEAPATAEATAKVEARGAEVAGFSAEAPGFAASGAPKARGYTGRAITLDFHDIEIRNLLRLIADVSKKNIVIADDVNGKVTISLRNIPWDQALDIILRAKGLGKEEMGNVIRVAKLDEIMKEQQARAEAEKARLPLVPLKVRILPVNFARAADLVSRVKDVLTERGTISTDDRTNVLIVKDIPEAIVRAEGLLRNLDSETPQVLIEARIVEASSNFNRALGVQWGGTGAMNQANGNPTGLVFPYNTTVAGAAGGGPTTGTAGSPNYAVNLPAAIGQGSGGGLGFTFGTIGGAFNLNLRLSALENNGTVKTISSPKISTLDNKEATIGQGVSIPFSQTSASGVNTTFIEAKLELKVTPHVTNDGTVLLKIKATNNAPNASWRNAEGQPSISKREAETEVLVKDGDTTVIGGIYTRTTAISQAGLPWLSKIPVLGFFFRSNTSEDDHTELLIFITPRILNRPAAAAAGGN